MQPEAVVFDAFGTLFDLDALRDPLGDDAFEAFKARLIPWMWHLTADEVQAYKPSPAIYELAQETFGIDEDRLLLVSAHEWDVAGARANGMRTAWVARGREPSWVLRGEADAVVEDLGGVAELANRPD